MVSYFFSVANANDIINQQRQGYLQLEKKWKTKNAYFRLETTKIGMCVVDSFNLGLFHGIFSLRMFNGIGDNHVVGDGDDPTRTNDLNISSVKRYGGILCRQLLNLSKIVKGGSIVNKHRLLTRGGMKRKSPPVSSSKAINGLNDKTAEEVQEIFFEKIDVNGLVHQIVNNPHKGKQSRGKVYTKAIVCSECGKRQAYMCLQCNTGICFDKTALDGGICFRNHIRKVKQYDMPITRSATL